jgi:hypothetical protein
LSIFLVGLPEKPPASHFDDLNHLWTRNFRVDSFDLGRLVESIPTHVRISRLGKWRNGTLVVSCSNWLKCTRWLRAKGSSAFQSIWTRQSLRHATHVHESENLNWKRAAVMFWT